jgi:hypothetical protein
LMLKIHENIVSLRIQCWSEIFFSTFFRERKNMIERCRISRSIFLNDCHWNLGGWQISGLKWRYPLSYMCLIVFSLGISETFPLCRVLRTAVADSNLAIKIKIRIRICELYRILLSRKMNEFGYFVLIDRKTSLW